MSTMPPRELAKWAKETVLFAVNQMLEEKRAFGENGQHLTVDEINALVKERDRIKKLYGL